MKTQIITLFCAVSVLLLFAVSDSPSTDSFTENASISGNQAPGGTLHDTLVSYYFLSDQVRMTIRDNFFTHIVTNFTVNLDSMVRYKVDPKDSTKALEIGLNFSFNDTVHGGSSLKPSLRDVHFQLCEYDPDFEFIGANAAIKVGKYMKVKHKEDSMDVWPISVNGLVRIQPRNSSLGNKRRTMGGGLAIVLETQDPTDKHHSEPRMISFYCHAGSDTTICLPDTSKIVASCLTAPHF